MSALTGCRLLSEAGYVFYRPILDIGILKASAKIYSALLRRLLPRRQMPEPHKYDGIPERYLKSREWWELGRDALIGVHTFYAYVVVPMNAKDAKTTLPSPLWMYSLDFAMTASAVMLGCFAVKCVGQMMDNTTFAEVVQYEKAFRASWQAVQGSGQRAKARKTPVSPTDARMWTKKDWEKVLKEFKRFEEEWSDWSDVEEEAADS